MLRSHWHGGCKRRPTCREEKTPTCRPLIDTSNAIASILCASDISSMNEDLSLCVRVCYRNRGVGSHPTRHRPDEPGMGRIETVEPLRIGFRSCAFVSGRASQVMYIKHLVFGHWRLPKRQTVLEWHRRLRCVDASAACPRGLCGRRKRAEE